MPQKTSLSNKGGGEESGAAVVVFLASSPGSYAGRGAVVVPLGGSHDGLECFS